MTASAPEMFTFTSASGNASTFGSLPVGPFFSIFTLVLGGTDAVPTISTDSTAIGYINPVPSVTIVVGGDAVTSGTIAPDAPAGGAAVTPEPSSIVLLGTGFLGVAGAIRRRFHQ